MNLSVITLNARQAWLDEQGSPNKYTDAKLFVVARQVYIILDSELRAHHINPIDIYVEAPIAAKDLEFTPLPADLVHPIRLWEKSPGSGDDQFIPMREEMVRPIRIQTDRLEDWWWANNKANFIGATAARDVRLQYMASIVPGIIDGTTPIRLDIEAYFTIKLAAIAALTIGLNETLADRIEGFAEDELGKLLSIAVKKKQSRGRRRKPALSPF